MGLAAALFHGIRTEFLSWVEVNMMSPLRDGNNLPIILNNITPGVGTIRLFHFYRSQLFGIYFKF